MVPVEGKDGITLGIEHNHPHRELLRRVFPVGQGGPIDVPEIEVKAGDRLSFVADMLPVADLSALVFDQLSLTLTRLGLP